MKFRVKLQTGFSRSSGVIVICLVSISELLVPVVLGRPISSEAIEGR